MIHKGLSVYIPCISEKRTRTSWRTYAESSFFDIHAKPTRLGRDIQRMLIAYIPFQIYYKTLQMYTTHHGDLLLVFLLKHFLKLTEIARNIPGEKLTTGYLCSVSDIYQKLINMAIGHEIHRGLMVYIPSRVSFQKSGEAEDIDPGIHSGLSIFLRQYILAARENSKE